MLCFKQISIIVLSFTLTLFAFEIAGRSRYKALLHADTEINYLPSKIGLTYIPGNYYSKNAEWDVGMMINRDGFRNEFAGTCNILALGDSFTLGVGSNHWATWPKALSTILKSRVYNSGIGDTNLNEYIAIYDRYFDKPEFKIVIMAFFSGNDFIEPDYRGMPQPLHGSVKLKTWLNEYSILYSMIRHSAHHNVIAVKTLGKFAHVPMIRSDRKFDIACTAKIINSFGHRLERDGKEFVLYIIPERDDLGNRAVDLLIDKLTVKYLDGRQCLKREHYWENDPHLNESGNMIVARQIAELLQRGEK